MGSRAGTEDAGEGVVEEEDGAERPVRVPEDGADQADDEGGVDLAHLRDLLSLLSEHRVSAFTGGGIQVAFHEPDVGYVSAKTKGFSSTDVVGSTLLNTDDDGEANIESRRAQRLAPLPRRDGMKHPSLWPGQGGKVLTLNGTLE